ncbi:hypothetical protein [Rhodococcus sp. JVH1]|uniref:hypothetical protein n=1 Tax=Rhodococcus sp. JVH1 TaxID=745408 RepID=UPI00027208F5|nr:hypothetical protein [Rhodococcus sp. JVH1]EJI95954.1 hypothetical protein JVH1_6646 [Rhodococcus sp. JVH1]
MTAYKRRTDDADAITERIRCFEPRSVDPAVWSVVAPWVRETVELSEPALHCQAANALKALSRFAVWAIDVGYELDRETVLVPEVVERYRVTGMRELAPSSRSAEVSRLRTVARAVTRRAPWPAPGAPGSRQGLSAPYTHEQLEAYWEAALSQNGPFRVQAMTAVLALTAAAAGARPGELFAITAADVIGVDGVVAVVLGPESEGRVVPVRAGWVERLERGRCGGGCGAVGGLASGRRRSGGGVARLVRVPGRVAAVGGGAVAVDVADRCAVRLWCGGDLRGCWDREREILLGSSSVSRCPGGRVARVAAVGGRAAVMAPRTSEEIIELYTPRMPAQQWEEIAAFVRDVVRRGFGPCCTRQWLNRISIVTSMMAWAREQGLRLDVEQIFHPATVNRYAVTVPGLADATRSCRRSALTALSRRVTRVAPWEPPRQALPHSPVSTPYTSEQVETLLWWAPRQASAVRRRGLGAAVALGVGAGLAGAEMVNVGAADVRVRGEHVIVTVSGVGHGGFRSGRRTAGRCSRPRSRRAEGTCSGIRCRGSSSSGKCWSIVISRPGCGR